MTFLWGYFIMNKNTEEKKGTVIMRREKMKRIASWTLALTLTIGLMGCSSTGKENETAPTGESEATEATVAAASTTEPSNAARPDIGTAPVQDSQDSTAGESNAVSANNTSSNNQGSSGNNGSSNQGSATKATEPPHTHSYTSTVVAATCTERGYTLHKCACGDSYKDNYTDALGHSWGDWTTTKEATTEAEGEQTRTCSRCGATETQAIDKLEAEVIDCAALAAYGRSYGANNYDFVVSIGTRAGYFPGYQSIITSMADGYSKVAGCVNATATNLIAAHGTTYCYLDVEVVNEGDGWYTIWVYYG